MSTERDELAEVLGEALEKCPGIDTSWHQDCAMAEHILAAGYRKPRTVTTAEELDALPLGSVVILRDAKGDPHPAQKGDHGWRLPFVGGFWTAEKLLAGSESAEVIA